MERDWDIFHLWAIKNELVQLIDYFHRRIRVYHGWMLSLCYLPSNLVVHWFNGNTPQLTIFVEELESAMATLLSFCYVPSAIVVHWFNGNTPRLTIFTKELEFAMVAMLSFYYVPSALIVHWFNGNMPRLTIFAEELEFDMVSLLFFYSVPSTLIVHWIMVTRLTLFPHFPQTCSLHSISLFLLFHIPQNLCITKSVNGREVVYFKG